MKINEWIKYSLELFLVLWLSLFIVSYFHLVSVYDAENRYQFIWTWGSASITNHFKVYFFPYIFNVVICAIGIFCLLKYSRFRVFFLHPVVFLVLIFIYGFYLFAFVGQFIIFDFSCYWWQLPIDSIRSNGDPYCRFLSFGDNQHLKMELCGRKS